MENIDDFLSKENFNQMSIKDLETIEREKYFIITFYDEKYIKKVMNAEFQIRLRLISTQN